MREIKFRGLTVHGEFVYGDLIHGALTASNKVVETGIAEKGCYPVEVDPKTVGQFTGLKDKNGIEIYDGDILSGWIHNPKESHIVKYISDKYNCGFMASSTGGLGKIHVWYDGLEVIGNIHENHKLLNGAK